MAIGTTRDEPPSKRVVPVCPLCGQPIRETATRQPPEKR